LVEREVLKEVVLPSEGQRKILLAMEESDKKQVVVLETRYGKVRLAF
jgi:hypothetical protein